MGVIVLSDNVSLDGVVQDHFPYGRVEDILTGRSR